MGGLAGADIAQASLQVFRRGPKCLQPTLGIRCRSDRQPPRRGLAEQRYARVPGVSTSFRTIALAPYKSNLGHELKAADSISTPTVRYGTCRLDGPPPLYVKLRRQPFLAPQTPPELCRVSRVRKNLEMAKRGDPVLAAIRSPSTTQFRGFKDGLGIFGILARHHHVQGI